MFNLVTSLTLCFLMKVYVNTLSRVPFRQLELSKCCLNINNKLSEIEPFQGTFSFLWLAFLWKMTAPWSKLFILWIQNSYVTSGGPVNVIYLKVFHREISSNSPVITEKSPVAKLSLSRLQELASFLQRFFSIVHNLNWS